MLPVKPGARFDVQMSNEGKVVLTPLVKAGNSARTEQSPMNQISAEQVRTRLQLLKRRLWPKAELARWLGIDFAEAHPLLAQYQMWSEMSYEAAYHESSEVDRCRFETFLTSRAWVTQRGAALQLAVNEESFLKIMRAAIAKNIAAPGEADGVFRGVYSAEFISDFYKHFPKLRNKTFPNLNAFYAQLHAEISERLSIQPFPLKCITATTLGEDDYATNLDAITEEPTSLRFQVLLETGKPIHLRPDTCSWLTYFRFEAILKTAVLGRAPEFTKAQRDHLQEYAAGR